MKKTKIIILMITLMVAAVGFNYIAGTYAKYTSTSEGSAVVSVAKWAFAEDNEVTNVNVELDRTIDASTLVAGKIAPGTSGAFGVNVNSKNTEVGVDFSVSVTAAGNMPSNLRLYGTQTCTAGVCEYSDEYTVDANTGALTPIVTKTGILTAKDAVGLDVELYWVWDYETGTAGEIAGNDVLDTTDGTELTDFTFTVSITGTQVAPSETPITSAFDA